mmetsp:Transcript_123/g.221  ORF Transcript_123/g.221 Transcript_123/m.221 type:complete len:388 (-) Transcript_123:62-1225(-)
MGQSRSRGVAHVRLLDPLPNEASHDFAQEAAVAAYDDASADKQTASAFDALEALRQTGQGTSLKGHLGPVNDCAVFPDGLWVLSAGADGTARIWDTASAIQRLILQGHDGEVRSCAAFVAGMAKALTGGADCTVRVWDAHGGECLRVLRGHEGPVFCCSVSREEPLRALTLGDDRKAVLWDIAQGIVLQSFEGPEDPRERREPINYRRAQAEFAEDRQTPGAGPHAGVISSDGSCVAIAGGDDGENAAVLLDASTGEMKKELEGRCCFGCSFVSDGKRMVTVGEEWTRHIAVLWDIETEERLCTLEGPAYINCCTASPEGNLVITAGDDGRAQVWRAPESNGTAVQVCTLDCGEVQIRSLAVFPDSCRLAVACDDGTLWLWNLANPV